ncbi:MAG: xanthine dehydrogenase molybdopterin binding subunit [Alphaproteobacteria bacterium]|nr:xanthine dehydrogenase molybdopterin binding subunit [Alphaproteobacteria bacterium]
MNDMPKGGVRQALRHDSAVKHVTGEAQYIDDMPELPGTLHAWLATSTKAHARILRMDLSAALALPGVAAIVTARDIPGRNDIAPILKGEPVLADGVVEHVGHPFAAVAAETMETARRAASLIEVEYEELPPILSIEQAIAEQAFVSRVLTMQRGDWREGLRQARHRRTGQLEIGGQDHFYLESQVALAIPQEDGDMLVHSSTQHPTEVQHGVATLLGLANNAVTVECRRMGGGFGGKESQATIIAGIAALLARRSSRPVKLRLVRDDDMIVTGKRHDFLIRYEVGFDDEGRIEAIDMELAARCGNVADLSPAVLTRALCHMDNCYFLPAVRARGLPCRTNTVSNTAFRGFGGPQGMLAIEAVIGTIAHALGRPADQVRAANYYGGAGRDVTPYGQRIRDNLIPRITREIAAQADYERRRREIDAFNATSPVIRKGLALFPLKFGISFNLPTLNQAGALVHVYTDGSVHLNHGGTEMGQGLFTKVAQVVAEVFRIDIDHIKVSAASTAKVPNTSATAASSGSDLNGMAAMQAAQTIKNRMISFAAEHFGVLPEQVEFAANRIIVGNRTLAFGELAHLAWANRISLSATGFYRTPEIHFDLERMQGEPFYYFTYGACVAEAAIDTLTGESRILRADILQDCGSSLNPAIDMGQIEGGFVQGMGWLTCEELVWDATGALRTHAPSTYKIPVSRDLPPVFNVRILEDAPNRAATVFRSKGIGEPPLMLAIATWLAIRDAVASVGGHRHAPPLDAPATPERILMAVEALRKGAG